MSDLAPSEIQALARIVDELDYYQLMHVKRGASAREVKAAYYSTSRSFHPDANRHRGAELREAVATISKRVTEAYAVLRDPRRRQAYDRLLDESDEMLADAAGGKTGSPGEASQGSQPMYDPEVEGFPFELVGDPDVLDGGVRGHLFLRIVAARVEPDRFDALRERYETEIVPELLDTPGCRAAFIVQGIKARSRALSVTIWESEEAAVRYEISGKFEELTTRISDFFSGLYQWKLSLAAADPDKLARSEVEISGYHIVTGRRLED